MPTPLALIVGLGNPGAEYARTRHNAGEDFVREIARGFNATLKAEPRFNGLTARLTLAGQDTRLLIPQTFMNRSGQAVGPMAGFFKLSPAQILVAYDELDLPPGEVRFKEGGGHGGCEQRGEETQDGQPVIGRLWQRRQPGRRLWLEE